MQSKYIKMHKQEILSIGRNVSISFMHPYVQIINSIFIKKIKQYLHAIQKCNMKFEINDIVCFEFIPITDTHMHRTNAKNVFFGFRGPQNLWIIKIFILKIRPQNIIFSITHGYEKEKKYFCHKLIYT